MSRIIVSMSLVTSPPPGIALPGRALSGGTPSGGTPSGGTLPPLLLAARPPFGRAGPPGLLPRPRSRPGPRPWRGIAGRGAAYRHPFVRRRVRCRIDIPGVFVRIGHGASGRCVGCPRPCRRPSLSLARCGPPAGRAQRDLPGQLLILRLALLQVGENRGSDEDRGVGAR